MINGTLPRGNEQEVTDYHRHLRMLEGLANQLERQDLDPQQALEVYRRAVQHYRALDSILKEVEREVEDLDAPAEALPDVATQPESVRTDPDDHPELI